MKIIVVKHVLEVHLNHRHISLLNLLTLIKSINNFQ